VSISPDFITNRRLLIVIVVVVVEVEVDVDLVDEGVSVVDGGEVVVVVVEAFIGEVVEAVVVVVDFIEEGVVIEVDVVVGTIHITDRDHPSRNHGLPKSERKRRQAQYFVDSLRQDMWEDGFSLLEFQESLLIKLAKH